MYNYGLNPQFLEVTELQGQTLSWIIGVICTALIFIILEIWIVGMHEKKCICDDVFE